MARWGAQMFDVGTPGAGALRTWIERTVAKTGSGAELVLPASRFVQDDIRYLGIEVGMARRRPTAPDQVFEQRYGDCKDKTALLVAMLRLGGLAAYPALVSSTQGPDLDQWVPSPDAFDHAIVRVTGPDGSTRRPCCRGAISTA